MRNKSILTASTILIAACAVFPQTTEFTDQGSHKDEQIRRLRFEVTVRLSGNRLTDKDDIRSRSHFSR